MKFSALRRLQKNLMEGKLFEDPAEMPTELDQLRRQVARLRLEVEHCIAAIHALRQTETYQKLSSIADWDAYFGDAREQLERECEQFRAELEQGSA